MRLFRPNVERMVRARNLAGLTATLSDCDPAIALQALDGLIQLGQTAGLLEAFRAQGAWEDWKFVFKRGERSLGRDAVPALVAALGSPVNLDALGALVHMLPMPDAPSLERAVAEHALPAVMALWRDRSAVSFRTLALLYLKSFDEDSARETILEGLNDDLPDVRAMAAVCVADVRGLQPEHLDRLAVSLEDPIAKVRSAAAEGLGRRRWVPATDAQAAAYHAVSGNWEACVKVGPAALEPLLRELRDADANRQPDVVCALGALGDRGAAPGLREVAARPAAGPAGIAAVGVLLDWHDGETLHWAVGSGWRDQVQARLAAQGPEGAAWMADALLDPERPLSPGIARALAALRWEPSADRRGAAYHAACGEWDRCVAIGEPAIPVLLLALTAADRPDTRVAAADALKRVGWTPGRDASGAAYWLARGDLQRCAAAGASAVPILLSALSSPAGMLRARAAEVLGLLAPAEAVEPLRPLMTDQDRAVASAAILALCRMGDRDAATAGLGSDHLRERAAEQLRLRGAAAIPLLLEVLKAGDAPTRQAARRLLGESGAAVVDHLVAALGDPSHSRGEILLSLGAVPDPRAVPLLISALADPDPASRASAAESLGRLREPSAAGPLADALKDPDAAVVGAAAQALARLDHHDAFAALVASLESGPEEARRAAAEALGARGDARAVEPLVSALGRTSAPAILVAIARALRALGWQPQDGRADIAALRYWAADGRWQRLAAIAPATRAPLSWADSWKRPVKSPDWLLAAVDQRDADPWLPVVLSVMEGLHGGREERQQSARALLKLYEGGTMSAAVRQRILSAARTVTAPHEDRSFSNDCGSHTDEGVGLPSEDLRLTRLVFDMGRASR